MNLKNKKIFSRIAAGVMTVAMAITLLPGTMKTVNAAGTADAPLESVQFDVTLYKREKVYTPNTTFEFTVTNLNAEDARTSNSGTDLTPEFKNALEGGVTARIITLTPEDGDELNDTSINRKLTFEFDASKFKDIGTYRYKVQQKNIGYEGIIYDTTEKYLDVIVAREGEKVYIENAYLIANKNGQREKIQDVVNTYGVKNPDQGTTTDPDGTVNDLVISKNVTGNYGERNKKFDFEITINGAPGEEYKLEGEPAQQTTKIRSGVKTTIQLSHGQKVKIYGLTANDTYTIKELAADDYGTTFKTTVTGSDKTAVDGTGKEVIDGKIDAGNQLQTQEVAFTNDRTNTATGFALSYGPYALMVVLAGAVAFVLFRKRRAEY